MCDFCENITNDNKEISWSVRSTYADDNICDFVNGSSCTACDGCIMSFKLDGYTIDENTYVGVSYTQEITSSSGEKAIIRPFSETAQFNFCPFCGKQISKTINDFSKEYSIEIEDKQ